ncbi:MAG: transposase [Verrucomicrobia bacterium]|nr:transposase [Verrucomicrobiota bacterium]
MTDGERNDFDSPWKEALEKFLRPFLALCFPEVEALIDWSREVVFLDTELQALEHDAEAGRQYVDKLIRTYQCDGTEAWILVHVEIQTQPDAQLAERMFLCQERLDLRHRRPVISLAVLADGDSRYRSGTYQRRLGGCWLEFGFPTCKLLDFSEEQLNRPGDPIAWVIRAHLIALRSKRNTPFRYQRKLELLRHLAEDTIDRETLYQLLRLTDWFLPLSEREEITLRQQLLEQTPDKTMPFVTTLERLARQEGREEGREEGLREAIRDVVLARFGQVPEEVGAQLEQCHQAGILRQWHRHALAATDLAAFTAELLGTEPGENGR